MFPRTLKFATRNDGSKLYAYQLPSSWRAHWVKNRRDDVLMAIDTGLITVEEAMSKYLMSTEELNEWRTR